MFTGCRFYRNRRSFHGTILIPMRNLRAGRKCKLGDKVRPNIIQVLVSRYKNRVHDVVKQVSGHSYELYTRRGPPFSWNRANLNGFPSCEQTLLGLSSAHVYDLLLHVFTPVGLHYQWLLIGFLYAVSPNSKVH